MRSLFFDIHCAVERTMKRCGLRLLKVLGMLGISRSRYYSQLSYSPTLDGRFNMIAVRDEDE